MAGRGAEENPRSGNGRPRYQEEEKRETVCVRRGSAIGSLSPGSLPQHNGRPEGLAQTVAGHALGNPPRKTDDADPVQAAGRRKALQGRPRYLERPGKRGESSP